MTQTAVVAICTVEKNSEEKDFLVKLYLNKAVFGVLNLQGCFGRPPVALRVKYFLKNACSNAVQFTSNEHQIFAYKSVI